MQRGPAGDAAPASSPPTQHTFQATVFRHYVAPSPVDPPPSASSFVASPPAQVAADPRGGGYSFPALNEGPVYHQGPVYHEGPVYYDGPAYHDGEEFRADRLQVVLQHMAIVESTFRR